MKQKLVRVGNNSEKFVFNCKRNKLEIKCSALITKSKFFNLTIPDNLMVRDAQKMVGPAIRPGRLKICRKGTIVFCYYVSM